MSARDARDVSGLLWYANTGLNAIDLDHDWRGYRTDRDLGSGQWGGQPLSGLGRAIPSTMFLGRLLKLQIC
jgi:hypothetical protein